MLKQLRQNIVQQLWATYCSTSPQIRLIENALKQRGVQKIILDHFALIDLPGPNTGIPHLSQLFTTLGYAVRGQDYLAEKQNDFLWLAEIDSADHDARDVLPQIVVADFRLEEMPLDIKKIIEKYAQQSKAFSHTELKQLVSQVAAGDSRAETYAREKIITYFTGRDWPLPTVKEFHTVHEFNELLAWVLIFGRRPNHFTLSIHLLNHFAHLDDFHHFIDALSIPLNQDGGLIKGGETAGIAQSSTMGLPQIVKLSDGDIEIPTEFVEFVWRYPRVLSDQKPKLWKDYFTGFIAQHADHVIESLYINE